MNLFISYCGSRLSDVAVESKAEYVYIRVELFNISSYCM